MHLTQCLLFLKSGVNILHMLIKLDDGVEGRLCSLIFSLCLVYK